MSSDKQAVRHRALGFLARREHSRKELIRKLTDRDISKDIVEAVVATLTTEGLQSDERFCESFIHHRASKGYGPARIQQELQQRGIESELIETMFETMDEDWLEHIKAVREKKFGAALPDNYKEQMKQSRFLQYRGFTSEQINRLFRPID